MQNYAILVQAGIQCVQPAGIKSVDFLLLSCAIAIKAWHTMWRKGSEYFARRCSQVEAARRRRQTIQAQPSVISGRARASSVFLEGLFVFFLGASGH